MNQKRVLASLFFFVCLVSSAFAQVKIESFTSPGGINIWLVRDSSVAVMSLSFSSPLATVVTMDKAGISPLTTSMLGEGAGNLDSHAFKEKVEELGVEMSIAIDEDDITGGIRTSMDNRFEAFRLFKMALNDPIFDPKQFEIVRQQLLTGLENNQKSPAYVVNKMVESNLYKSHPYAVPMEGTLQSLKHLTLEDVKNFFHQVRSKSGLCVTICGDISRKDAGIIVDEIFGSWKNTQKLEAIPNLTFNFEGKDYYKEVAGGQSLSIFVQQGLYPTDKDFTKLVIANFILGGYSDSRLFMEVRKKHGLAYSIETTPTSQRHAALFNGSVGTDAKKIHQSLNIIKKVWKEFQEKGVTAKELETAKNYLIGSFAFAYSSTNATTATLLGYMEKGFNPQYVYDRTKRIEAVSLNELNTFIKEFFTPDKLTFFTVGNGVEIKAQPPLPPMKPTGVPSEVTHPVIDPPVSE